MAPFVVTKAGVHGPTSNQTNRSLASQLEPGLVGSIFFFSFAQEREMVWFRKVNTVLVSAILGKYNRLAIKPVLIFF